MVHLFSLILSTILLESMLQPESQLQTNNPFFLSPLLFLLTHHKFDVTLYIIRMCHPIVLTLIQL
jgi:hypothetical protein